MRGWPAPMERAKTQLSKRFLGNGGYVALTTDTGDRTRFCDRVLPERASIFVYCIADVDIWQPLSFLTDL